MKLQSILIIILQIHIISPQEQQCYCQQIQNQERCNIRELCSWNSITGCSDYNCNQREKSNCERFEGSKRCVWSDQKEQCEITLNCQGVKNHDHCFDLKCSWNYKTNQCTDISQALACKDYSNDVCNQAFAWEQQDVYPCAQNTLDCIYFKDCEIIDFKETCDMLEECIFEDGKCRNILCSDFPANNCLPYNSLTKQLCIAMFDKCEEYICQNILNEDDCENHPGCIWLSRKQKCVIMNCKDAINEVECLYFQENYNQKECYWDYDDICRVCSYGWTVMIMFILSLLII